MEGLLQTILFSFFSFLCVVSCQEDVTFPGHLFVQYLLCFFLPFLTPWCLSKFNSGHRGSSNSKLKYTNLSHLQSITEADTGMCNLIDCFPPSLLMKSSPELLHPSPCLSQQKVNYLQKKLQFFCISDIDSVCDLDKQRLNTSVFQPVK